MRVMLGMSRLASNFNNASATDIWDPSTVDVIEPDDVNNWFQFSRKKYKVSRQLPNMSVLKKASDAVNNLCLKLYAKLTEDDSQESNAFFSPISISVALAMIYAGTKGNTAKEIEQLFNWDSPDIVHEMMEQLQGFILSSSGIELHLANRLWAQQGFAILEQYTNLLKSRYQVEMGEVNFQRKSEEARKAINQWVEEKTNAKIKDMLDSGAVRPDTKVVLVNAVYFKGLWEEEFSKEHSMD